MSYVAGTKVQELAEAFAEHDEVEVAFNPELSRREAEIALCWIRRDLETGVYHKAAMDRENFGQGA